MLEKVSRNTSIRSFHLLIKCKFFLLKLPMDTAGGAGMCPSPRDPWATSVKRTGVLLLHEKNPLRENWEGTVCYNSCPSCNPSDSCEWTSCYDDVAYTLALLDKVTTTIIIYE